MDQFSSEQLKTIIAEILGVSATKINAGSGMQTTERWDSFAVVNLVVAIELETGVEVSPEELENFTTFSGILQLLDSKGIFDAQ